jgi:ribosome maturation factor RimP
MDMEEQGMVHKIARMAKPLVHSLGLALWGIEIIPAGRKVLRVYVDTSPGTRDAPAEEAAPREAGGKGPDIDQCAKLSRLLGLALDAEDIIPGPYVLELSSPGLERPFFALAQLAPYVGSDVSVKLAEAPPELPDRKRLRGKLLAVGEQAFTLLAYDALEGTRLSIPWDKVRRAELAPELPFSKLEKPGKKKSPKADATQK